MQMKISEESESIRANCPEPIHGFTEEESKMIDVHLTKYSEEAQKLKEEAERRSTSCIYRVLPRLQKINGKSLYRPKKVSIGPYYYNLRNERFKMAEDCKRKCIGSLLVKTTDLKMQIYTYKRCLQRIRELEVEISQCYSEEFKVAGLKFLEMMVLDACFIIEIIEKFGPIRPDLRESGLGALEWMVPYFYRDFLLLENQIPFFVLEEIYAITHKTPVESCRSHLKYAALEFFKNGMKRFDLELFDFTLTNATEMNRYPPLHLLDLVRSSLIPLAIRMEEIGFSEKTPFIHCISMLRLAGIKVSPRKARIKSFLEVRFKKGVIEMPNIAIDDLMRCLLLNCVAFEQCHQTNIKYFTVYATFLDCLVNTEEDVEYLRERNVIDNYLADDSELAGFINRAGKDLELDIIDYSLYLGKLFKDVDKHYRNRWKWKWANFEREYFEDKPWLLMSAVGGILLVLATLFQSIMAFLTYKNKSC